MSGDEPLALLFDEEFFKFFLWTTMKMTPPQAEIPFQLPALSSYPLL